MSKWWWSLLSKIERDQLNTQHAQEEVLVVEEKVVLARGRNNSGGFGGRGLCLLSSKIARGSTGVPVPVPVPVPIARHAESVTVQR